MTSQDQIDANRLNAKKSTGPRTPGGRKRSSHNALKHGLTAEKLVTSGEDAQGLKDRLEALIAEWDPVGASEMLLVQQMAVASWRAERALRTEAANYPANLLNWRTIEMFELALRYGSTAERTFYRAVRTLAQLQAMRRELTPRDGDAVDQATPVEPSEASADGPQ